MKNKIIILLALTVLLTAAALTQISIKYEKFTLPNGLTVILHEDHTIPMATVNIRYHVGSGREKPGRTGFAHLFEHLMFGGSGHVPFGKFDEWLEAAGGNNNGSTTEDRTNYYENVPSSALELALFLESDRMGYLLDSMSPGKVNQQRDVVKNERRQSYENRPYGMSSIILAENLYTSDHPYHWPVIGSMEDLSAASYEDVVDFFKKYYTSGNASLVIAGDIDPALSRALVTKWFSDVPPAKPVPPMGKPLAFISEEKRLILEDKVQLPRLSMNWLTPPEFSPGDAELQVLANVLAGGKNSRLYKRLVYDLQIAQDVYARQSSSDLSSQFSIVSTARSGHNLSEIELVIREEIDRIKRELPTAREIQRTINQYEAGFLDGLENIGNKADQLNAYYTATGNPDYFNEDLARFKALDARAIQCAAQKYLRDDGCVLLSVVPQGKRELAASAKKEGQ